VNRLLQKFKDWYSSCDIPQEIYSGWKKVLIPLDLTIAYLSKRSFLAYHFWEFWISVTRPAYPKGAKNASVEITESIDLNKESLSALEKDGFVAIERAFSSEFVHEARSFILALYKEAINELSLRSDFTVTESGTKSWEDSRGIIFDIDEPKGRYRFGFPMTDERKNVLPDSVRYFSELVKVHEFVEDYYGSSVFVGKPYVMAEVMVPNGVVENWHIDCFRKGCKAFLYLNDVGEPQGPLRYVKGSHRTKELHWQIFRVGRSGLDQAYFDEESNSRFDSDGVLVTGSANTLLVFDNRGIHAGSKCSEGMRIALVNGFRPAESLRINARLLPNLRPN